MDAQSRCFPYEKSIVINVLYDTIEALGLCLDSSNSIRGTLIVSDAQHTGSMRIALTASGDQYQTKVDIYPQSSNKSIPEQWSAVILDELCATIQRACCSNMDK